MLNLVVPVRVSVYEGGGGVGERGGVIIFWTDNKGQGRAGFFCVLNL